MDAYKAIIDHLANKTSAEGHASNVTAEGMFSRAPAHDDFNKFVQGLSTEQREILAKMLHTERTDAIHDSLALLDWWMDTRGIKITIHGEPMPTGFHEMGLHGDYIARCEGMNWPDEE